MLDGEKNMMMTDTRLSDNCYHWDKNCQDLKCNLSKSVEKKLWHKRLGHLSLSKICKIMKAKAFHGIPLLKQTTDLFCYPVSKQIKMSHKINEHGGSSWVLELLHLDLMESMQVVSLGGKRYVLVIVNDHSQYTL